MNYFQRFISAPVWNRICRNVFALASLTKVGRVMVPKQLCYPFLDMVAFYRKCNVNILGIIKLLNLITFSKSIILDGWKNQPY